MSHVTGNIPQHTSHRYRAAHELPVPDVLADRQRRLRYFLSGCPAALAAQIASGAVRLTAGPGGYVRFLEGVR